MSHPTTMAVKNFPPLISNESQTKSVTRKNDADKTLQKVNDVGNLNHLNQINEIFCKLAQESRRRSSQERLRMLQKISDTSNFMHSQQLSGSSVIGAFTLVLFLRGHEKSGNLFENTTGKVLASLSNQHQTRVKELEIFYQAEQEKIAKSRDDERAHMQRWEQYLQSEHSSKLRFFS